MGYLISSGPLGAFREEQNRVDVPELFVVGEVFPRKRKHSCGSSKMSFLLC